MLLKTARKSDKFETIRNMIFSLTMQKADRAFLPRSLSLEITECCNLDCPMCPRKFTRISNNSMQLEKFLHIVNEIPSLRNITLLGRGETLIAPDFFRILELGPRFGIKYTVVTNGTLLNNKNIGRLNNVKHVVVSIDSPVPEEYAKIRGADLSKIEENLSSMKEKRKDIYLNIQCLIMRKNIMDLPDLVLLARKVNADRVTCIHPIGFSSELDQEHGDHTPKHLLNNLAIARELAIGLNISFVATPLFSGPRICHEPWTTPRISLTGDVYPCCYIYESAGALWNESYQGLCLDVNQSNYIMGNIFSENFDHIWNNKRYKMLRRTVRKTISNQVYPPFILNGIRNSTNSRDGYNYCRVCLFRQNRAC